MIFGVDVSNHQTHFDFAAAAREGFDFAFVKCSQNDNFRDGRFVQHANAARAAGLLVAAYHYQGTAPVARQLSTIKAMAGTDIPIILDVEDGSGGIDITRALVAALRAEGYQVPLTYLPRWYWSGHLGSPNLSGLPPLWVSWYPDYTVRRKESGIDTVPNSVWNGYGGLDVAVVQFTSSGAVADYPGGSIDLNAFAGTRAQLVTLLEGEDDVNLSDPLPTYDDNSTTVEETLFGAHYHAKQADQRAARIEVQLAALGGALSDAETHILAANRESDENSTAAVLAAIRAQPTGGQVDVPALAAALRVGLGDEIADDLADELGQRLTGTQEEI
jgi:hypothetical protein